MADTLGLYWDLLPIIERRVERLAESSRPPLLPQRQ